MVIHGCLDGKKGQNLLLTSNGREPGEIAEYPGVNSRPAFTAFAEREESYNANADSISLGQWATLISVARTMSH